MFFYRFTRTLSINQILFNSDTESHRLETEGLNRNYVMESQYNYCSEIAI